jgi:hypothetical protein
MKGQRRLTNPAFWDWLAWRGFLVGMYVFYGLLLALSGHLLWRFFTHP